MNKTYKTAVSGILTALSAAISAAESFLPLPLGVKPGFSNLPVMLAMSEIGIFSGFSIMLLKSLFVFLTRGVTAFIMSLCGGLLSFGVMLLILRKTKASFLFMSVMGSLAHNTGQILASCVIMNSFAVAAYLPVLIISGCIAGIATGFTAHLTIPAIKPFLRRNK